MKIKSLSYLVILCILTSCAPKTKPVAEVKTKPNIIVILIDDAGYADFGFMGNKDLETPEIDKLAASGTIFTDAHVTASVCSPSRAGLLSGRYQQRNGFECNGVGEGLGLSRSETTLASALKSNGYKTVAIGKWHLGDPMKYRPNQRGFDEFYGFLGGSRHYFYDVDEQDKPGDIQAIMHNNEYVKFDGYLTDVFGDQAVGYIDKYKKDPFFMYLAFNAVHSPLDAKKEDLEKYKGHPRQKLAAMIWSLDQNVGKVINKLKAEGLLENTLIYFLSDNGGATDNESSCLPLKGWKGVEFEGGTRVPFVVSWKGHLPAGNKYNGLTSSLDIYATSLDVAGAKLPINRPLDGVSLIPVLTDKSKKEPHDMLFWRKDQAAAARIGDYKMIRLRDYGSVLYNIKNNLGETVDLSKTDQKKAEEVSNLLKNWESQMMQPLWTEGKAWNQVVFEMHQSLMKNEKVKRTHP